MAYWYFLAGIGCLMVAVTVLALQVRRLERELNDSWQFMELFTKATIQHVKELREATNLTPIKAEQE